MSRTIFSKKKTSLLEKFRGYVGKNHIMVIKLDGLNAKISGSLRNELKGLTVVKKKIINLALKGVSLDGCLGFYPFDSFGELPRILGRVFQKGEWRQGRIGEISQKNCKIEEGITSIKMGPMLKKLTDLEIDASIKAGKIVIKKEKTFLSIGDKIEDRQIELLDLFDFKNIFVGVKEAEVLLKEGGKIDKDYINQALTLEDQISSLGVNLNNFIYNCGFPTFPKISEEITNLGFQMKNLIELIEKHK